MNPINQKLFDSYCDPILQKDALAELHYHWSLDAFTVGLHLGLSLRPPPRRAVEPQTTHDSAG